MPNNNIKKDFEDFSIWEAGSWKEISTETPKFKKVRGQSLNIKRSTKFGDFCKCDQVTLPWVKAQAQVCM